MSERIEIGDTGGNGRSASEELTSKYKSGEFGLIKKLLKWIAGGANASGSKGTTCPT